MRTNRAVERRLGADGGTFQGICSSVLEIPQQQPAKADNQGGSKMHVALTKQIIVVQKQLTGSNTNQH